MSERHFETAALRLAAIVESSDDAIVSKDLNGTITSWNRGAERIFGFTAQEAIGQSIYLIIPADRHPEEDEVLRRIRSGDKVDHFETVRLRKDGTRVPISLTVSPLRNTRGQIIGASKIARDISERKRAEAALLEVAAARADLQSRLLSLLAASGKLLDSPRLEDVLPRILALAAQTIAADGYALWWLDRAAGAWRIGAFQGVSREFADSVVSSSQTSFAVTLNELLVVEDLDALPLSSTHRDAYRHEGIASLLAVPLIIEGEISASLALYYHQPHQFTTVETQTAIALSDLASAAITTAELYSAEARGRGRADFLASAASALATSLDYREALKRVAALAVPAFADWCAVDLAGESGIERLIVAPSDPASVESVRRFDERYPADPACPYSAAHVIRTGTPAMLESIDDGTTIANACGPDQVQAIRELGIVSLMCVPLVTRGRTLGALTLATAESRRHYAAADLRFVQDVAWRAALALDRARAYEEVRRASQLKDDFLATLSHELRTPLNAILGYARMLKSGMVPAERQARAFEILEKNASALTQIVEDVLDVSRIVAGKIRLHVQPVDLPALIVESTATIQPAADAKGVRVETRIDASAAAVPADPDRLQQVIWNLMSNAVKFTPRGGRIEVAVERVASHMEIVVSDTGIGIAPEFLPHMFERFRQADSRLSREHGGLGLGLAICRHLVEMHGGTIVAASEGAGKGATFRVRLPVMSVRIETQDESKRTKPSPAAVTTSGAPLLDAVHVLAVDDDEDALMLLREILGSAGAQVTTAQSAGQALAVVADATPDVLLADIGMPGADGLELIGRIRQLPNASPEDLPAAALTAYARSEDRVRALQAGFQMHLAKPIDPGELIGAVAALAHRKVARTRTP